MPRTKRNKVVSLTKTPKRNTRDAKSAHIDSVREAAQKYPTIVTFYVANLRNTHLQEVRSLWKENSKVIFGKNKVVAKALGQTEESEVREGISGIAKKLAGPVGILFTDSKPEEVLEWFADYARKDFARAGNVATQDVILEAGPVMMALDPPENLPHSLEPQLRSLGMPTELKRGVPTLTERFVVASKGKKLSTQQAQILKHLLIKDAQFRFVPMSYWTEESKETKSFPLSIEDEKLVAEYKSGKDKKNISNKERTAAKKSRVRTKAELEQNPGMDEDDDEEDDEEADDDEDEELDDDFAGDKVTKSMMLPAGL